MQRFAELLDSLVFQPARNEKLRLIVHYLETAPDPDRGYAMAVLTGALDLPNAKPAALRALGAAQTDEVLFALSYDYVGDLAEALALVWRAPGEVESESPAPTLGEVVTNLQAAAAKDVPELIAGWLDRLDATGRWALLKLITGALRVGVSARLAKTALAQFGNVEIDEIEQLWHGREPPYSDLFLWLTKQADRPHPLNLAFRPFMLAHPLEEEEIAKLPASDFRAEWKWDGIRVQLVAENGQGRIYSRGGEEIGKAFPDILEAMHFSAVLDGELLVAERPAEAGGADPEGLVELGSFNKLQQRLNRKTVTQRMLSEFPAHVRLYDLLDDNGEDLRGFPFDERRTRLETWLQRHPNPRFDLSPLIPFTDWDELAAIRARARSEAIEGLMLKRGDSLYLSGRVKGPWYKWKRDPLTIDAVVMYAQRGHGKRSSFYSDYTFGCWREGENGPELVPVGKAYSGFTDAELKRLDKWVRDHTKARFGPVREVEIGLVVEVAFDAVQHSNRHKSGVALRFPRIKRLRWDKPPGEADRLETLTAMIA
jgi:DNA ligase-1